MGGLGVFGTARYQANEHQLLRLVNTKSSTRIALQGYAADPPALGQGFSAQVTDQLLQQPSKC